MKKILSFIAAVAMAFSLTACGETVPAGSVGVKVKQFGSSAGVVQEPLSTGWAGTGFGESIVIFPKIQKTFSFDAAGENNDEIAFSDKNGALLSGDVNITLRVIPQFAPKIYEKYRQDFEGLLFTEIRRDIRTFVAEEAELVGVENMLGGGRQEIIQKAYKRLQTKWAKEGIEISQLGWQGNLRLPKAVAESIAARTQADQQKLAAEAQVAVAEADALRKIAEARGDAESARIRGEALRTNPQILQQQALEKWDGKLPVYVGSGPVPFVKVN